MNRSITARGALAPEPVGAINRRLFGSFIEHMGRAVYTGIFEPGHPTADHDGFRQDVLELIRGLGVSIVRYPGGNFVSGYRWEDGVGPVDQRPARLDLAWHTRETNEFGLDEFIRWTHAAGVEPMLALNLGTRGVEEALDLLEYANHPSGTALSDRRAAYGSAEPHAVRMWCLGNELDGPWQVGHKTALEYGRLAAETARAMRRFDPSLELVAVGSSGSSMPTFGDWERTVLTETYDLVDSISLHSYYQETDDLPSFLASAVDMDRFIEQVTAIADEVGAAVGSERRMLLSFDEWNVWHFREFAAHEAERPQSEWPVAPPLAEDVYTAADAVVVGSLLISLLKHADRVTCACIAQLVNTIAPISTEPGGRAWRQASYYPFAITSALARGNATRVILDTPTTPTERFGAVPAVDAVAATSPETRSLTVFAVNRDLALPAELDLELPDWAGSEAGGSVVNHADPHAHNTAEAQVVAPQPLEGARIEAGRLRVMLPPVAWAAITVSAGGG